MYHSFLIHSSADGHLGCFHVLAIVNRTDVEAETPILWSPDAKGRLIGKDPDAGKD